MDHLSAERNYSQETELASATRVADFARTELARIQPVIEMLETERHRIFDMQNSPFDATLPIVDQLYPENSYNDSFTKKDLDLRKGATAEFHNESEKYNPDPSDSRSLAKDKREWRHDILVGGQELGFTPLEARLSTNPMDQRLGILESTSEKIEGPVEAVIVAAAAGISTHKRLQDAFRDIESGKINTNKIIITSCERTIPADERGRIEAVGLPSGETEYDAAVLAAQSILGASFEDSTESPLDVQYSNRHLEGKKISTQVVINDQLVDVIVVSAPVDPLRRQEDGSIPRRANTDETFLALKGLLSEDPGTLVVKSHDAWILYQHVIAEKIFGLEFGKNVIVGGPFNAERLYKSRRFFKKTTDIDKAEAVVDEIAKYHTDLVKLLVASENKINLLSNKERPVEEILEQPVPNLDDYRARKAIYRTLPIDKEQARHFEPVIEISDFNIAGQAYYSRDNATTSVPIPEVEPSLEVRASIANTLSKINNHLKDPRFTEFFGGEVELYLEDGLRTIETQTQLYHESVPALIREQSPELSEEEVMARRDDIIGKPSLDPESPSPHATGGAFDVVLRYKQNVGKFIEGVVVPMGHKDGETTERIAPDYFETHSPTTEADQIAQRNRRAFYRIMTGEAFGFETGFSVNPTEFFHWSRGDQLASFVSDTPAYYSFPVEKAA